MSSNPAEYRWEKLNGTDAEIVTRGKFEDDRGIFEKPFLSSQFEWSQNFNKLLEVNLSFTAKAGTIRGFHMQSKKFAECKIISCIAGKILDVFIDCRAESETYGQVVQVQLESQDGRTIIVPRGFAHGFQTLTENTTVLYFVDQVYQPEAQLGINPLSPQLREIWPLQPTEISAQDLNLPSWGEVFPSDPKIQK